MTEVTTNGWILMGVSLLVGLTGWVVLMFSLYAFANREIGCCIFFLCVLYCAFALSLVFATAHLIYG